MATEKQIREELVMALIDLLQHPPYDLVQVAGGVTAIQKVKPDFWVNDKAFPSKEAAVFGQHFPSMKDATFFLHNHMAEMIVDAFKDEAKAAFIAGWKSGVMAANASVAIDPELGPVLGWKSYLKGKKV